MKPSCEDVLAALRRHPEGLSALTALDEAGCFRLGARVWDLRREGYNIQADLVTTASGKRIASYRLIEQPVQLAVGF